LAFPYAYSETGLTSGIIVTLALIPAILYGEYVLIACSEDVDSTNYVETVEGMLNQSAARFCNLVVCLALCGSVMSYISLIGDLGNSLTGWNAQLIMFFAGLAILFPCLQKKTAHVGWISGLGLAPIVLLLFVVWVRSFESIVDGSTAVISQANWEISYMGAFPLFAFAFQCHATIPPIYAELQQKTVKQMTHIVTASLAIESFVYMSIGVLGYLSFGEDIKSNIIDNYSDDDIPVIVVRCTMVAHFLFAIPINFVPNRTYFYQFLGVPLVTREKLWVHITTTVGLFGTCVLLAILAPSASLFFSLTGSTCGVVTMFIFPGIFAYLKKDLNPLFRWPFVVVCFILTFVIGVGGTYMTVIDTFF